MLNSWSCAFCVLFIWFDLCAAQETCYPPGGVAGIVVATIIVTFVVGGLGTAVAYKLWTRKTGHKVRDRVDGQHQKQSQKPNTDFAFDNPYFRDPEANDADQVDKGKERSSMNNKNSLRSSKLSELSSKGKKPRSGKNHFMFGGGGGKKHRALDDSCLSVEPERTIVSLRGHDFTGLGFNICGNMRDGILVKDVLHRGPASESGLIKAGDKIINVTVSFTNIVYEDALTILSYASPYDVQLEIERVPEKSRALPNTPSGSKRLGSCSFNNSGQKLFHPLYRSQSIDDLTQIDKDTFPSHGIGPRRSQSVGVAAHKLAAHFKNSDSKLEDKDRSAGSLMLSTTGSLNEKMLANVMADGNVNKNGLQWEKRFEDTLESEDSISNNDTQITNINTSRHSKSILKVSRTAAENVSDSSDEQVQNIPSYKQNKYLDSPHQRGKLEEFKVGEKPESSTENIKTGRAKTMADASNALWHLDQSIKEGDISASEFERSRDSPWNQSKRDEVSHTNVSTPIIKSNRFTKREEANDSDVSNDSLELSNKKRGNKKSKKPTCSIHTNEILKDDLPDRRNTDNKSSNAGHKQNYQQKSSKKCMQQSDIKNKMKAENASKHDYSNNSERVYANNILNKSVSPHNLSCMNDDQKLQIVDRESYRDIQDSKQNLESSHFETDHHKQSSAYANHRDVQDNLTNRNTQKILITDSTSNYGKVNGRNAYGEKQKLSSAENYSQNYGCTNRITINGESDEHKSKLSSSSKTTFAQKNAPSSYQTQDEITRNDSDTRYLDKNKSNINQKFIKKSAHPAGMFTQINPFQQPSRQKNANFKIWTGREDIKDASLNGTDPSFSASISNSYVSCDSSHLNRRDYLVESQNFGQRIGDVSKTVLISTYDNTTGRSMVGTQGSPMNYRQQHK